MYGPSRFIIGVAAIGALATGGVQLWARTAPTPNDIGLVSGRLHDCPNGNRCVNSEQEDPDVNVPPITCGTLGGPSLFDAVRQALGSMPRTSIMNEGPNWVHAVAQSSFFGFKDDVEIRLSDTGGVVHIRSESRLGDGDLGVNRERVLELQMALDRVC